MINKQEDLIMGYETKAYIVQTNNRGVIKMVFDKMKPKSSIPNQDGFKFIGIDKDYKEHYCIIRKEDDGCFYMNSNTCVFSDLLGWVNDSNN